jgi:hypothetical protein
MSHEAVLSLMSQKESLSRNKESIVHISVLIFSMILSDK